MSETKRMRLQFPVIWIDFSKSEEQTYESQEICQQNVGFLNYCMHLNPHTPLTHTEDYLFLEFLDGISRHKKHLLVKFLPVIKAIWRGDKK